MTKAGFMMKLQDTQNLPLSAYPLFSGTDIELSRRALSRIFNPVFLEPAKKEKSFQFSVNGVKLPNLWISSLYYKGNPVLGPVDPSNYHTLQLIPSGSLNFDVDGNKISATEQQGLMLSSGQRIRVRPTDDSQCLSLVVKDAYLRDVISTWTGHSKIPSIQFQKQLT
ncbi:MAG: hypothetical protein GQ559_08900, partial [Desulfobulbaceae bacterium]|nr:hypothetical protein [Desulfobulbaceae bacterium]